MKMTSTIHLTCCCGASLDLVSESGLLLKEQSEQFFKHHQSCKRIVARGFECPQNPFVPNPPWQHEVTC